MNKFKRQRRFQSRTDSGATFSGEPRAMRRKHDAVVYVLRMKPCVLKKQKHTMSMVNIAYWTRPLWAVGTQLRRYEDVRVPPGADRPCSARQPIPDRETGPARS